jgi:hypothetical protein
MVGKLREKKKGKWIFIGVLVICCGTHELGKEGEGGIWQAGIGWGQGTGFSTVLPVQLDAIYTITRHAHHAHLATRI